MQPHALGLAPALRLGRLRLASSLLLAAALAPSAARAQGGPAVWEGLVHEPLGQAALQVVAGPALRVSNLGSSGLDGVATRLPQPDGTGLEPARSITLAPVDPLGSLPTGARLEFTTRGPLGGVPDQLLGTLTAERAFDGRVELVFDHSPLGATTYTIAYYDGLNPVGLEVGVGPTPGYSGPLLRPNCDADPICCWLGQVVYIGGHWVAAWNCLRDVNHNGSTYSCNRVVVTPENPLQVPNGVSHCELRGRDVPEVTLVAQGLEHFATVGTPYCSANPNSTGAAGAVAASGSSAVADGDLRLFAVGLPQNANGYFVVSPQQAFVPNAGGSQGNLCVGASTGRFIAQLANSGAAGVIAVTLDLAQLPQPNGSVPVLPGETWNFQCWHRDADPGPTSNFTSALSVLFE